MAAQATEKRSGAAEEINGAPEKRRNAMPQMTGFGSSLALTRDALCHRVMAAYDEEKAAGYDVACLAIGCLLTWMYFHRNVPLEETNFGPRCFTCRPVPRGTVLESVDTALVYSVTVKGIKPEMGFQWPLDVYGFVAARDNLDWKCNIIFHRDRNNCQMLTEEFVKSLVLTGPSRAVVACDPINFEIELKVKGSRESEDKILSFLDIEHNCIGARHSYGKLYRQAHSNKYCTTEFLFAQLRDAVEPTIEVRIIEGLWSQFCARFVGRTKSFPDVDFVLLDHRGGAMVESDERMIKLSRSVVTVESDGELEFTAEALELGCNTVVVSDTVQFTPKRIGTTEKYVNLGFCKMEVFVSSLLPAFF